MIYKQKGLALVQVLIITAIIAVLLLAMTATSQNQQDQVLLRQQVQEAKLDQYTTLNRFYFLMLTENWATLYPKINFYGEPFSFENAEITLQNLSSLVSLKDNQSQLQQLLSARLGSERRAESLAEQITRWQELNFERERDLQSVRAQRNELPLQHITEVINASDMTPDEFLLIAKDIQTSAMGAFNPVYAPNDLLDVLYSQSQAQALKGLRESGRFDADSFMRITGIEEEGFFTYFRGPDFRITIKTPITDDELSKSIYREVDLKLAPYDNDALVIYKSVPFDSFAEHIQ